MNFHALLRKLFKVSSVLHLRVILNSLLLHFSFCFPSCFSYYAPLANSELTVNLSFFCWHVELKHLREAELPGRTPAASTGVAWRGWTSVPSKWEWLWSRGAGEQSRQLRLPTLQLDTVSTPHCYCVHSFLQSSVLAARSKWHPGLLCDLSCVCMEQQ